jgi:hypothetical protein
MTVPIPDNLISKLLLGSAPVTGVQGPVDQRHEKDEGAKEIDDFHSALTF